jgi:hypothetical protein
LRETFAFVFPIAVLAAFALLLGLHLPEPLERLLREAAAVPGGLR